MTKKPDLKILPPESKEKVLAPIFFMQAGLERLEQDGLLHLVYHPEPSCYYEEFIEHEVTLNIRFRTEYPSEKAKEMMKDYIVKDGDS